MTLLCVLLLFFFSSIIYCFLRHNKYVAVVSSYSFSVLKRKKHFISCSISLQNPDFIGWPQVCDAFTVEKTQFLLPIWLSVRRTKES